MPINTTRSNLSETQILQRAFEESNDAIRVNVNTYAIPPNGTNVLSFAEVAALGAGANASLTYTVGAGKNFFIQQWSVAGSGVYKVEFLVDGVVKLRKYGTSSVKNIDHQFALTKSYAAGVVLSLKVYNIDSGAIDANATFEGFEI